MGALQGAGHASSPGPGVRRGQLPVEGQHATGDGHVHGDLGGHAPYEEHLLARVRVES